jgi:hypothetical protein
MIVKMLGMLVVSMRKVQAVTVKVDTVPLLKVERVTLIGKER